MNANHAEFVRLLTVAYENLFNNDAEYAFSASRTTPAALAVKMTDGLAKGSANKDGAGIRWTCKALSIPYTYKAIRTYLNQVNS